MIFDDIGSFPLPEWIDREWVRNNVMSREYDEMVQKAFLMKLNAGVECPNYPQFQEMVEQFMEVIKDPNSQEGAYLVSSKDALIPEINSIRKTGHKGPVRVCLTGPFELYYKEFGQVIYDDILENLALSIFRFGQNAIKSGINVKVISIDEPSLGTNPELQPTDEQLKNAFRYFNFKCDVQIHLHSPLYYTKILDVSEINVIGVEAAKDPRIIHSIDVEDLNSHDKKLRVGIARSDIDSIVSQFNQENNVNAWKDINLINRAINEIESPDVIYHRLQNAFENLEDRIAYTGTDCGLFSFPTQESALIVLNNISKAISKWNEK